MRNRKGFLMIVLVLIFAGYIGFNYFYKENQDTTSENSSLEISAPFLLERFKKNDATSLLNKTITVTGVVSEIEENTIILSTSVYSSLKNTPTNIAKGTSLAIKGRCIGYDEVLKMVKMDQCTIVE